MNGEICSHIFVTMILLFSGINGYNFPDPHSVALDYRSIGFRECVAEVARYLMSVEGMDLQDPLRLRLLSHLQCFSTQRLAAAKSSFQNTSWNSMPSHPSINSVNQYTGNSMSSMAAIMPAQHSNQSNHLSASTHNSITGLPSTSYSESRISQSDSSSLHNSMRIALPSSMGSLSGHSQLNSMSSNSGQSITPPSLLPQQINTQFPMLNSLNPMMSPNSYNSVKPYRPWGSEITY